MAAAGKQVSAMHSGMTWRRRIRLERAARLTAQGIYTNEQIASALGIHVQTLVLMKQTHAFQNTMMEISTGIIAQENQLVANTFEAQREELADMVPMALLKLRELTLSKNPQIALKAAGEILDRDGRHSKVSRTSVSLEKDVDLTHANTVGDNIMNILRGASTAADGFTVSAAENATQINLMADQITEDTLDKIDEKKLPTQ